MQYSGQGADDSKCCNIRDKSSHVQYSGQDQDHGQDRKLTKLSTGAIHATMDRTEN